MLNKHEQMSTFQNNNCWSLLEFFEVYIIIAKDIPGFQSFAGAHVVYHLSNQLTRIYT